MLANVCVPELVIYLIPLIRNSWLQSGNAQEGPSPMTIRAYGCSGSLQSKPNMSQNITKIFHFASNGHIMRELSKKCKRLTLEIEIFMYRST